MGFVRFIAFSVVLLAANLVPPVLSVPTPQQVSSALIDLVEWNPNKGISALVNVMSQIIEHEILDYTGSGHVTLINKNTPLIDGSLIYGSTDADTTRLRSNVKGGLLINTAQGVPAGTVMVPGGSDSLKCKQKSPGKPCTDAGDLRCNEHTGLVAIHSCLVRDSNRFVALLAAGRQDAGDAALFQAVRKLMKGIMQHLTYNELLPAILGTPTSDPSIAVKKTGFSNSYDRTVNPSITLEFGMAAIHFHTLQTMFLPARDDQGNFFPLRQHFWNPDLYYKAGILDELLVNFPGAVQQTQQPRQPNVLALGTRGFAAHIQEGRQYGVPSYVVARANCGLSPIRTFQDLERVMPQNAAKKLESLYNSVGEIDLFSGGILENKVNGIGLVGQTFACIITEQFRRLKSGDPDWYENEGVFTAEQLHELRKACFAGLLCLNTPISQVQPHPLFVASPNNPVTTCQQLFTDPLLMEPFYDLIPKCNTCGRPNPVG